MRRLSLTALLVWGLLLPVLHAQSPHGTSFKVNCNKCHSAASWKLDKSVFSFDHNETAMPLQGSHQSVSCRMCHTSLVFNEAKSTCASCHKDIHENTTGPDCERCHNSVSWIVANTNDLHRHTRFPLSGAHQMADCSGCHPSASRLRFEPQGITCVECHRSDFLATTQPNHVQSGFSEQCMDCHSANSFDWKWNGSQINHSFFPLTLGHSGVDCNQCHTNGNYSNASSECVSCHLTNYNNTTNPNHATAQYPQTCNQCHSTAPGWKPASFDHSQFPLTQGHSGVDCSQCHTNGNYSNVSSSCVSCHQTDYNQTTNPNHGAIGLSTTCSNCHTTTPGWKPASFTVHDTYFPIYSGTHNGEWNSCTDCHANTSDYSSFSCLGCHEHNQTDMDREHSGRDGYSYTSSACLECHPRGND